MIVDVLFNHLIRYIATGHAEIPPAPKMPAPVSFPKLGKFLLHFPRRSPLHRLDQITFSYVGRYRHKDVDMVRRYNTTDYRDAKLLCNLSHNLSHSSLKSPSQNFVTIFCDPNYMESMVILGVTAFAITFHWHRLKAARLEVEGFKPIRGL